MRGSLSAAAALRWEAPLLHAKAFFSWFFFLWKVLQFCNLVLFALNFAAKEIVKAFGGQH